MFWTSLAVAVIDFWSLGIMHNFTSDYRDPQAAPTWATVINMLADLAGVAAFVWSLVITLS